VHQRWEMPQSVPQYLIVGMQQHNVNIVMRSRYKLTPEFRMFRTNFGVFVFFLLEEFSDDIFFSLGRLHGGE